MVVTVAVAVAGGAAKPNVAEPAVRAPLLIARVKPPLLEDAAAVRAAKV